MREREASKISTSVDQVLCKLLVIFPIADLRGIERERERERERVVPGSV